MRRLPFLFVLFPAVALAEPVCSSSFASWTCFSFVAVAELLCLLPSLAVAWFCFVFNGRPGWGLALGVGMAVAAGACPVLFYAVTALVGPRFHSFLFTSVLLGVVTFVGGWAVLRVQTTRPTSP